jgi:hypothetical protein
MCEWSVARSIQKAGPGLDLPDGPVNPSASQPASVARTNMFASEFAVLIKGCLSFGARPKTALVILIIDDPVIERFPATSGMAECPENPGPGCEGRVQPAARLDHVMRC